MRFAKALGEAVRGWFSLSYLEFVDALMLAAAHWEGRQISGFKSSSAFQRSPKPGASRRWTDCQFRLPRRWENAIVVLTGEWGGRLKFMSKKPWFPSVLSNAVLPLIARLFISAIFLQGALGKIMGWSGQASYMQSHHLPAQLIPTMLGIALLIEAAGVVFLIVGWQARAAAFVMFLYLGVVSVLLHNFWAAPPASAGGMQTQFLKNLGIMGGLLMIAACGAGRWSLDEWQCKRGGRLVL